MENKSVPVLVPDSVVLRQAGSQDFGIRYFDNVEAFADGRYLFETFPATRESLAIKSANYNSKISGRSSSKIHSESKQRLCNAMNATRDKFEQLARELQQVENELQIEAEKKRQGQPALGAGEQIEIMLKQISVMREQVELRSLPPADARVRGMARMVVDSWPMDNLLGDRIIAAEQAYLKLT